MSKLCTYQLCPIALFLEQEIGVNFILTVKGSHHGSAADSVCILGAHYDTQEVSSGVDNNGSGMAAMLEIVRLLLHYRQNACVFVNTLVVVAFDWQEGVCNTSSYQTLLSDLVISTLPHHKSIAPLTFI